MQEGQTWRYKRVAGLEIGDIIWDRKRDGDEGDDEQNTIGSRSVNSRVVLGVRERGRRAEKEEGNR